MSIKTRITLIKRGEKKWKIKLFASSGFALKYLRR